MWLHSSPKGFADGDDLLAPSRTGVRPRTFADDEDYQSYGWYSDDRVYIWRHDGPDPLDVLDRYPWSSSAYYLYEVSPTDVGADGDVIAAQLGSSSCGSALVVRCLFNPRTDTPPMRWFKLDIMTVPPDPSYRDGSREWASRVNWKLVNDVAVDLLERDEFDDRDKLSKAGARLSDDDRWALYSLRSEPVGGSPDGVTNGIHRMEAMRAQGVRFTVALE